MGGEHVDGNQVSLQIGDVDTQQYAPDHQIPGGFFGPRQRIVEDVSRGDLGPDDQQQENQQKGCDPLESFFDGFNETVNGEPPLMPPGGINPPRGEEALTLFFVSEFLHRGR